MLHWVNNLFWIIFKFIFSGEVEDDTVTNLVANLDIEVNVQDELSMAPMERVHFHSRTGSLVKLSYNARTAERLRPLDEFNNGVVMTHRPLQDDQLFEVSLIEIEIKNHINDYFKVTI